MANRTQKAAMKKRADDEKAAEAAAKKPKAPGKAKPKKGAKARSRRSTPLEFEEVQVQEASADEPAQPGFFARMRARREEKAHEREARRAQEQLERIAAEERRQAEEAAQRAAAEAEAQERARQQAAEARKAAQQAKREEAKAQRDEEKRLAAEEKAREEEEARLAAEEKARKAEEAKERRRQQRQAERAAIEERERRLAEEAEAADREREARKAAKAAERAAARAAAAAAEPEPDLEFEEASEPVDERNALVPTGKGGSGSDDAAEKMAAELARRRSKPVVLVEEETPLPRIPKSAPATPAEDLVLSEPEVREEFRTTPPPPAPTGLSIPEMFLLVASEAGWDERAEKAKPGHLGGALAGSLLLELLVHGRLLIQRDRFTVVGEPTGDEAVAAVVHKLRQIRERKGDLDSLRHMRLLAKWDRELLEPYKDRLASKGYATHSHRMHLGLFYRSQVDITDLDAQERLRNKLRRAIAGGGTPEASSILLLGLLDACGLLSTIVPDEAMDYNRKRLNGLLSGRDVMGYAVDKQLKGLQEIAIRTILQNVRTLTFG